MLDPTPTGTRDVLPDEMRELRSVGARLRAVFEHAGYAEVHTPALEYERTFARPGAGNGSQYRLFDEHGHVLVLRSDMTVPIARLAANRYAQAPTPLRFSYLDHAYRKVRPQRGQSREILQAGVELLGVEGVAGTAEALRVLIEALEAVGLDRFRVGVGDVTLYPALLDALGVVDPARDVILTALVAGDFVAIEHELERLPLADTDAELLLRVPRMRGGAELLADLDGPLETVVAGMRGLLELLSAQARARIIFDFGLVRSLDYYTGAIFQVYDPDHGAPLGSGGRYDELLASFGRPLPAVGFALDVERVHIALRAEESARG